MKPLILPVLCEMEAKGQRRDMSMKIVMMVRLCIKMGYNNSDDVFFQIMAGYLLIALNQTTEGIRIF
jgi:hypothetical protein